MRPEFFTDATMADFSAQVRLTYIGLWCVADDAGWLTWDPKQIGAQLYPFEAPRRREAHLATAFAALSDSGRVVLHPCGCLHIPHLVDHQKIGGNKSLVAIARHRVHTGMDESARYGKGRVGYGTGRVERETSDGAPSLKERLGEFPDLLKVIQ